MSKFFKIWVYTLNRGRTAKGGGILLFVFVFFSSRSSCSKVQVGPSLGCLNLARPRHKGARAEAAVAVCRGHGDVLEYSTVRSPYLRQMGASHRTRAA